MPKNRPASNKRLKTTGLPTDSLISLGRNIVLLLLEMLNPTDMKNLAKASLVLETWMPYSIVVRNAVLSGGYAKRNVQTLLRLVHEQKIFFPSVARLLDVSCKGGKPYDICGVVSKKMPLLHGDFGLFLCTIGSCNSTISIMCKTIDRVDRWAKFKYRGGFSGQKWGLLAKPTFDERGIPVGPILTYKDLCTMLLEDNPTMEKPREPHVGPPYYDTYYEPVKMEILRACIRKLPRSITNPTLFDKIHQTLEEASIEAEPN